MSENRSLEIWRAIFHVGVLMLVLAVARLFPEKIAKTAAGITMSLVLCFEILRLHNAKFADYVHAKCSWGFRKQEYGRHGSLIDGAVGVTAIFFIFPIEIFTVSILLASFPDPIARFIGRGFGKVRLPFSKTKTWIGSFSFFITSCVILLYFYDIFTVLVVATIATIVEAYSLRKYHLDDNLTVPIVSALLLWSLS